MPTSPLPSVRRRPTPGSRSHPARAPGGASRHRRITASLMGLLFLGALDMTLVSSLLPTLGGALGAPALQPWLMSLFMAAMALSGLAAGALADRHGSRAVMSAAVALFVTASLGAGLAPDMAVLLLARVGQGAGAGMIIVLAYAALSLLEGPAGCGRAQGLIGLTWGAAALAGPLIGLLVLQGLSWRAAFLVPVPVGLALLAVFRHALRPGRPAASSPTVRALSAASSQAAGGELGPSGARPLDLPAQAAFGGLLFLVMLLLSAPLLALDGLHCAVLGGGALVAAAVLGWRVRRDPSVSPLPLAFLCDPALRALLAGVPMASMGLYAAITFLPQLLGAARPGAAGSTGLSAGIAAAAGSFVAASFLASPLVRRHGSRAVLSLGLAALATGSLLLGAIAGQAGGWGLLLLLLAEGLCGAGMGAVAVAAVLHAQSRAPAGLLSTYTSAVQVLRNVGAAMGIQLFAGVQALAAGGPGMPGASGASGARLGYGLLALLLVLCIAPARALPGKVASLPGAAGPTDGRVP